MADGDPLTPLYLLVGAGVVTQVVAAGFAIVKGLAGRAVSRELQDKEKVEAEVALHTARLIEAERALDRLKEKQGELRDTVEQLRGIVATTKGHVDERIEKQAGSYRAEVKDLMAAIDAKLQRLEADIRQDMTRAIHDAIALGKRRSRS
jgi:hypothetical protein